MESGKASETAMCTALMRATHARRDPYPILRDKWGDVLVSRAMAKSLFRHIPECEAPIDEEHQFEALERWLRANPAYAGVLVRARYVEDALERLVNEGVAQYVIIGAGFDSFALRSPQYSGKLKIFEVDHQATQALKTRRVKECLNGIPGHVTFVTADLAREKLDEVLPNHGFDPERSTLFSWLGVTMYLERDANLSALAGIRRCGRGTCHLILTYLDQAMFDEGGGQSVDGQGFAGLKTTVSQMNEPLISGFHPDELPAILKAVGFELREDIDNVAAVGRYDPERLNGLKPVKYGHVVWASAGKR